MLIDTYLMERYRAVMERQKNNWNSIKLKIEADDEIKVKMMNPLFNIISDSDFNSICLKYFKEQRVGDERSNLWMHKGLEWENN